MSPYVITTRRPGLFDGCRERQYRHAVATLEEARQAAVDAVDRAYTREVYAERADAATEEYGWRYHASRAREDGQTFGPLPDGTVIEVEPVELRKLREDAGLPFHPGGYRPEKIIDAFNTQHDD